MIGLIMIGGVWYVSQSGDKRGEMKMENTKQTTEESKGMVSHNDTNHAVEQGTYTIVPEESTFSWAGKKPLIEGYINSGTIDIKEGTITKTNESATGTIVLSMNTLHVGLTAKKPGQEGMLEEHLKGKGWFDAETYPTAQFTITKAVQLGTSSEYEITGDLTLKGKTHTIVFPATIFSDNEGAVHARASMEIDRTKWGLTAGSGNFFDSLGDNMISDMVALSFDIVAKK